MMLQQRFLLNQHHDPETISSSHLPEYQRFLFCNNYHLSYIYSLSTPRLLDVSWQMSMLRYLRNVSFLWLAYYTLFLAKLLESMNHKFLFTHLLFIDVIINCFSYTLKIMNILTVQFNTTSLNQFNVKFLQVFYYISFFCMKL